MNLLRNLTLGHYYPIPSAVHALDPRVKLIGLLLGAITLFALDRVRALVLFSLASVPLIRLGKLPLGTVVRGLRPFAGLFLLTACLQLFFTAGEPLVTLPLVGSLHITREGCYQAVLIGGQLCLFILFSSIFTLTTSPLEVLHALQRMGSPLARVGVPVADLTLAMLLCIRFLPVLDQEARRIVEAQRARGIDTGSGTWRNRLQNFHAIFLPLLYNVFWRAEELATAMTIRGYGQCPAKGTFRQRRLSRADHLGLVVVLTWCLSLYWLCR
jgi:energy-coupling factor transport system permease protein